MINFEWANASTVDDAAKLLKPSAAGMDPDEVPHAYGGGQDLLTTMKEYLVRPPRVVNLKTIKGLDEIKSDGKGGLILGATATLFDLEHNTEVKKDYPGLAEAAASIGTPQIRNMGTIGGNLCQRPRCWYFRLDNVKCRKKGGDTCYAASGQNKYNAIFPTGPSNIVHPSDLATMLTALGASLTIVGPQGKRTQSIEEFFVTPEQNVRKENILVDGEIVTEVLVPAPVGKSTYLKFKERESLDFAMSAVAAVVELGADRNVSTARLVLGGVASIPWRVEEAEKLLVGKPLSADNVEKAVVKALEGAQPLEHNGYKVPLTQALIRRALAKLNA
ncbi:MAG TPA: xanthine dehydrogenase family protein subunit M [Phycisphaerae bacterium]|jgi:xanthine dehydrogenase YagS FAD-binding subunit